MNTIIPQIFLGIMLTLAAGAVVLAIVAFIKGLGRHFSRYGK
ncbi:hypothetical protein Cpin_3869 [Chitinophaga pinensis DSM 2588]|uniref:Uncharacterized protein n=1 Tax=Chitinophaga pinensis (strain ATCC 43595 / DSM 2588 / LMG 13176 / NBRC 15968 / NCIMB 11800 / UQM 2034) TaxID=485918 RepID=A0A979G5Y2_CHIPD|nr:hypothetical protein Cpin_3869 [Chitinophaga pinensis DSM 2588]